MGGVDEKRAKEIFAGIGLVKHLGVELRRVDADSAEMSFVVAEKHGNYLGGLHGGAIAAVMDTVVFFPGRLLPSGRKLTTEGIEVHFFRPVSMGERVTVRAQIMRLGRRVCTVEAKASDPSGKEIASAVVTLLDLEA
ncbi:MAG: PaaI family thioesterase [Deferrisomatales bacterium]|nr:PaaI family thioesterase [Deferrisomatales bacterium]